MSPKVLAVLPRLSVTLVVLLKVILAVPLTDILSANVAPAPVMVSGLPSASVGVLATPVQSMLAQVAPAVRVTVWLPAVKELALKATASMETGTAAPAAPPEVSDQWLVSFQFPVPPTQ